MNRHGRYHAHLIKAGSSGVQAFRSFATS